MQQRRRSITELSPAEEEQLRLLNEERLQNIFSTAACDQARVEENVRALYKTANLDSPQRMAWVESPLQGILLILHMRGLTKDYATVESRLFNEAVHKIRQRLFDQVSSDKWSAILAETLEELARSSVNSSGWQWFNQSEGWLREIPMVADTKSLLEKISAEIEYSVMQQSMLGIFQGIAQRVSVRSARRTAASIQKNIDLCQERAAPVLSKQAKSQVDAVSDRFERLSAVREFITRQLTRHVSIHEYERMWTLQNTADEILNLAISCFDAKYLDLEINRKVFRVPEFEKFFVWEELFRSLSWIWLFSDFAILCRKPTDFNLDSDWRFHCERAPALRYSDGWQFWCWHGTAAPQRAITDPVSLKLIDAETNIEIRRILIARYGESRYVLDSGARKIDSDRFGTLYWKDMPSPEEPIMMVHVINKTPEPDGSFKEYFLRVPPFMRSARDAVAWTFNVSPEDYDPEVET